MNMSNNSGIANTAYKVPSSHLISQVNLSSFPHMIQVPDQSVQNPLNMEEIERDFMIVGELIQFYQNTPRRHCPRIRKKEKEIHLGAVTFRPSRGDWQCNRKKCRNWNYAKRNHCNVCKSLKEDCSDDEEEWECSNCGFGNFSHKTSCFKCGEKQIDSSSK